MEPYEASCGRLGSESTTSTEQVTAALTLTPLRYGGQESRACRKALRGRWSRVKLVAIRRRAQGSEEHSWTFCCPWSTRECEERLASAIAPPSFLGLGKDAVRGAVSDGGVRLYYIPRGTRNSFTPYFYGRIRPAGTGSEVVGEFMLHPCLRRAVKAVVGFMSLCTTIAAVACAIRAITGQLQRDELLLVLVPLVLALGWTGMTLLGRYVFGASNERRVVSFIVATLDARIGRKPPEPRWPGKSKLTSMYLRLTL